MMFCEFLSNPGHSQIWCLLLQLLEKWRPSCRSSPGSQGPSQLGMRMAGPGQQGGSKGWLKFPTTYGSFQSDRRDLVQGDQNLILRKRSWVEDKQDRESSSETEPGKAPWDSGIYPCIGCLLVPWMSQEKYERLHGPVDSMQKCHWRPRGFSESIHQCPGLSGTRHCNQSPVRAHWAKEKLTLDQSPLHSMLCGRIYISPPRHCLG